MATKQAQVVMKKEEDRKEALPGTAATREQQWRGLLADTTVGQFLQARDSSGAKKAPQGSNTNEPSFSSSLPSSRHVVTLSSTATVAHALQVCRPPPFPSTPQFHLLLSLLTISVNAKTLAQHRILSAPVMDATTLHFMYCFALLVVLLQSTFMVFNALFASPPPLGVAGWWTCWTLPGSCCTTWPRTRPTST